jgi:hypothetical protein
MRVAYIKDVTGLACGTGAESNLMLPAEGKGGGSAWQGGGMPTAQWATARAGCRYCQANCTSH